MIGIEERLRTHRQDILILLEEVTRTAQMYAGVEVAAAVSHLARAQRFLAEELRAKAPAETRFPARQEAPATGDGDITPVDGIRDARWK
jgi:hypothetical protein